MDEALQTVAVCVITLGGPIDGGVLNGPHPGQGRRQRSARSCSRWIASSRCAKKSPSFPFHFHYLAFVWTHLILVYDAVCGALCDPPVFIFILSAHRGLSRRTEKNSGCSRRIAPRMSSHCSIRSCVTLVRAVPNPLWVALSCAGMSDNFK